MFKRTTTKESKIKDIVKFLKLLPEAQIDQVTEALLYGRISAVSATRLIEPTAQTTKIISNDEAPLETKNVEKIMQKSPTLFVSKPDTKKNRLAIFNAYKKLGVYIEIIASNGKDNFIKPAQKQNSDKFNEVTKEIESKLEGYGVRIVAFNRKYNKGGKTL
jgi:hypothetical protein